MKITLLLSRVSAIVMVLILHMAPGFASTVSEGNSVYFAMDKPFVVIT